MNFDFNELNDLISIIGLSLPMGALCGFICWCIKKVIQAFFKVVQT